MIPEIGQLSLCFAGALAFAGSLMGYSGNYIHNEKLQESVFSLVAGQFFFVLMSFLILAWSFLENDFSVAYVANHSNSILPWQYKISAVWGGHEGSFLLWILIMTIWMMALVFTRAHYPRRFFTSVLAILCLLNLGFICFSIFTSNPFERLIPMTPIDGADLNPQLQDFGLIVHPPLLYMGYVGLAVPFAFALAGLSERGIDSAWARLTKPWVNLSWAFLTCGILLGSWWAYYELGWGGWWFWDPVENASFMPWLAATALLHSMSVTEKRGAFKNWSVLLAITGFSLSLLGAFIVRSGVLTSVHSFAVDPERGAYILVYLTVVVGGSLLLFAMRSSSSSPPIRYGFVSRESFMQINNLLFFLSLAIVLWGTLAPIGYEIVTGDHYSIGKPFFNFFFVPIMLVLSVALGCVPLLSWKKTSLKQIRRVLKKSFPVFLLIATVVFYVLEFSFTVAFFCCVIGLWVAVNHFYDLYRRFREGLAYSLSYLGMQFAHLGFAMTLVGVAFTTTFSIEEDTRMVPGDEYALGPLVVKFLGVSPIQGPNYVAQRGSFLVVDANDEVYKLLPEKRTYAGRQIMTEAGIEAGFFADTYISMGEPLSREAWAVRLHYKPLVRWIWFGALLMALGGLISAGDYRYRKLLVSKQRLKPSGSAVGRTAS